MARHTGEKPHQCSACDYKTAQKSNLMKHIKHHHNGERPHQCPHCDYRAGELSDVRRHMRNRHVGESLQSISSV